MRYLKPTSSDIDIPGLRDFHQKLHMAENKCVLHVTIADVIVMTIHCPNAVTILTSAVGKPVNREDRAPRNGPLCE
jgi:hypothetical protein